MRGLSRIPVASTKEVAFILEKGVEIRSVLEKKLNLLQARSHSVAILWVKRGGESSHESQLVMCDLAGSEKLSKHLSENQRLQEGIVINNSFSALQKVVNVLNGPDPYDTQIRYKDSKLTMALKDSLKPSSSVCFIVTVYPTEENFDEVVATLRYSDKLKATMKKIASKASLLLPGVGDEETKTNEKLLG